VCAGLSSTAGKHLTDLLCPCSESVTAYNTPGFVCVLSRACMGHRAGELARRLVWRGWRGVLIARLALYSSSCCSRQRLDLFSCYSSAIMNAAWQTNSLHVNPVPTLCGAFPCCSCVPRCRTLTVSSSSWCSRHDLMQQQPHCRGQGQPNSGATGSIQGSETVAAVPQHTCSRRC
jgi:hypothetical protein